MSKIDSKMAVFLALKNAGCPQSSADLLQALEGEASLRSIRRWLQELIEAGVVQKRGGKKSTRYFIEEKAEQEEGSLFSPTSELVLAQVTRPIYLRDPRTYQENWLSDYQPNVDFYLSSSQRANLMEQGTRSEFGSLAGTYAQHIYNRLLIDLSYNSSRLEGNTYSLLDTEKLLIEGIGAETKLDEEKIMILNHKEAIRYLVNNAANIQLAPDTITTLHYLLSDGLLLPQHCGVLRNHSVKIGGSVYLPIDNVKSLEAHLSFICKKASKIQDPFEQSFFLLVHLAYLQAFEDCNKRTSRLSANIPLIQKNLVPLSFNDIPKNDYIHAMLAIYELNDYKPLADLYCFSYARTCKSYDVTVQVLGFDRLRVIYREQRRTMLRYLVTHLLHKKALQEYLEKETSLLISAADRQQFLNIMQEDIALLDHHRIAGLGISQAELTAWKKGEKP